MIHIIVDGYNIIRRIPQFVSAERDGLESGRFALLAALEDYAAAFGYRVTVVFDGGSRPPHIGPESPREERFAGIDIVFSSRGESADTAIQKLLVEIAEKKKSGDEPAGGSEIVVTDDFGIRDEAMEHGAFVRSTEKLFEAMEEKKGLRV